MIEIVLCERNHKGEKTGRKVRHSSDNGEWLARQASRTILRGTKKKDRKKVEDKFYGR